MDPATFLEHYGFELEGQPSQVWVERWSQLFPDLWIPAALLEALYQGRYKAASVEQLLRLWQRRGSPHLTFPPEIGQFLWQEQQERIRSLAAAAFACSPLPPVPPAGSLFSREPAISLNLLLEQLQELPPKLRRLLAQSPPPQLTRAGGAESSGILELQQTVVDPPTPAEPPQGQS
ncbi:hypothetical protein NW805_09895 [Synechococcus sp. W60.1]|uniref:hypothetical protein n=1 Tax=Synechococcus sp. W60.1 TaxID=2964516 RepID=UPI0039C22C56